MLSRCFSACLVLAEHDAVIAGESSRGEKRTYAQVGATLLVGLLLSIGVMTIGLVTAALRGGSSTSHVLKLDQVLPHLLSADSAAVLDLGILLLFATPLIAVLVALLNFLLLRDMVFAAVTAVLLLMLALAFGVALR